MSGIFKFSRLVALASMLTLGILALVSCSVDNSEGALGEACTEEGYCLGDLVCIDGVCMADSDDSHRAGFGEPCETNSECASGLCTAANATGFCTVICVADSDCTVLDADACCDVEARICLLSGLCNTEDGDTPTDGDDPVGCDPDATRCSGSELQLCNMEREWVFYRDCEESGKICYDGACLSNDPPDGDTPTDGDLPDGDIPTDGDSCVVCTPDAGCEDDLEYCFVANIGEDEGCCEPYCDLPGVSCPAGYSCQSGTCRAIEGYCVSSGQCDIDEFCNILPGRDGGVCQRNCFEMGENCPANSRCEDNPTNIEGYGRCIQEADCISCSYDAECAVGQFCSISPGQTIGCCADMCGPDNPCPGSLGCCDDGRCSVSCEEACECDPPAYPPYVCDPLYCIPVLPCPACPENHYCDAYTAPNCVEGPCTNPPICGFGLKQCCFGYSCSAIIYGVVGFCI